MQIVKVQLARSIWLFDTQELNPRGLSLYPEIFTNFGARYGFTVLPRVEDIHAGRSLIFKQGKFSRDGTTVDFNLEYHSDGLVADTRHSTETSNTVLLECVTWLAEQLGSDKPLDLVRKRAYRSELIVEGQPCLETLSEKLEKFNAILHGLAKRKPVLAGLVFSAEDSANILTLDRRAEMPFDSNRYYSMASIQTSQHIEALNALEGLMNS